MVPMPVSGIYITCIATISLLYCSLLSMTQTKKTLPDNRSQCGAYSGKWQYGQLLMNKVALPVSHTDTHAAWLMQTLVDTGWAYGQMQTALFPS